MRQVARPLPGMANERSTYTNMTPYKKKQFGIWMDQYNATVVGRTDPDSAELVILGHLRKPHVSGNSNENAANNQAVASSQKFFKEIAAIMPNVDEVHVTGTGQVQEQFIRFLARTPQYRNTTTSESTSERMTDAELLAFISAHFN